MQKRSRSKSNTIMDHRTSSNFNTTNEPKTEPSQHQKHATKISTEAPKKRAAKADVGKSAKPATNEKEEPAEVTTKQEKSFEAELPKTMWPSQGWAPRRPEAEMKEIISENTSKIADPKTKLESPKLFPKRQFRRRGKPKQQQ